MFALDESTHEITGRKLLARRIPLLAIRDFDLLVALALVQIGEDFLGSETIPASACVPLAGADTDMLSL